jgi:hypothetical protein
MSESFIQQLSSFTPNGSGLDRDGLLFAAGRASAGPQRRWLVLCGVLAVSQLFTVALLWPRPSVAPAPAPNPQLVVQPIKDDVAPPAGVQGSTFGNLRQSALATEGNLQPPARGVVDHAMLPEQPLHAFAAASAALRN